MVWRFFHREITRDNWAVLRPDDDDDDRVIVRLSKYVLSKREIFRQKSKECLSRSLLEYPEFGNNNKQAEVTFQFRSGAQVLRNQEVAANAGDADK